MNQSPHYVVLLGPHAPLCERARQQGLGVIVLDKPEKLAPGVLEIADHVVLGNYDDIDLTAQLISVFCDRLDVVGILSLTESGLLAAARLNERLGFPDNPVAVVDRTVNKQRMRERLASEALYRLPALMATNVSAVQHFAAAHGFPLVLKPHNGAGSTGVTQLRNLPEYHTWVASGPALPVLVENFAEGPEYSVEAYSVDGEHVVVAVTQKVLHGDSFVEAAHAVPAPLSDEERYRIEEFVKGFLDVMGLRWGLTHTEVIVSDQRPVVVETHTRNGGDRITDIVQLATGVDLLAIAVSIRATGQVPPELAPASDQKGAAVRFLIPAEGRIAAVKGVEQATDMPGVKEVKVTVQPGETIVPVRSSRDRAGMVLAIGPDSRTALERATAAAAVVQIVFA